MLEPLLERQRQPLLIVISGPSGVGKDAVLQAMKQRDLPFHFVVTATSRSRRPEEIEGVDYIFVTEKRFEEMIAEDEFIEHALVYNQYKGIPKRQVRDALESGKDVVLRLDVQGAETVRRLYPQALLIFLATRTRDELVERLKRRETETGKDLEVRISTLQQELEKVDLFDYYVLNPDGELEKTVDTILSIVRAEHNSTHPRQIKI
jgi:guanylate kinase